MGSFGRSRPGPWPTEPAEKPYQLIPFTAPQPQRTAPPGHGLLAQADDDATLAGVLRFTLTTLTPLHVALGIVGLARSAQKEEFAALPVVSQRYSNDPKQPVRKVPLLPGSSLKGAVRSAAEALSPSCLPVVERRMRPFVGRHLGRCTTLQQLCPACRLFGNTRYAGHVFFADLRFAPRDLRWHGSPLLWQPGRGAGLKRRYVHGDRPSGRKFYFHRTPAEGDDLRVVIRQGVSVPGQVVFEGLRPADLGLLVAALGVDPDHPFPIKVGGGKPVGLGSVKIDVTEASLVSQRSSKALFRKTGRLGGGGATRPSEPESHLAGEALTGWLRTLLQEAAGQGVLLPSAYDRLQTIYAEEGLQTPAPHQPY